MIILDFEMSSLGCIELYDVLMMYPTVCKCTFNYTVGLTTTQDVHKKPPEANYHSYMSDPAVN